METKVVMVEEGGGAYTLLEMTDDTSLIIEVGFWVGELRRRKSKIPFPSRWKELNWNDLSVRREIMEWYHNNKFK